MIIFTELFGHDSLITSSNDLFKVQKILIPHYNMKNDVCNRFHSSITHQCVTRRERVALKNLRFLVQKSLCVVKEHTVRVVQRKHLFKIF